MKTNETETRTHQQINMAIFGRDHAGKVDKSDIHTATIFTGLNRDGFIESVHDRVARFLEECTGGYNPAETPAYQITGVQPA